MTTVRGRLGCKKSLRNAFAQFCRNCSRELGFGAQTDELGWSFIPIPEHSAIVADSCKIRSLANRIAVAIRSCVACSVPLWAGKSELFNSLAGESGLRLRFACIRCHLDPLLESCREALYSRIFIRHCGNQSRSCADRNASTFTVYGIALIIDGQT